MIEAGTYSVKSIDESGAGDAFAAGYITGLLGRLVSRKDRELRQRSGRVLHERFGMYRRGVHV